MIATLKKFTIDHGVQNGCKGTTVCVSRWDFFLNYYCERHAGVFRAVMADFNQLVDLHLKLASMNSDIVNWFTISHNLFGGTLSTLAGSNRYSSSTVVLLISLC